MESEHPLNASNVGVAPGVDESRSEASSVSGRTRGCSVGAGHAFNCRPHVCSGCYEFMEMVFPVAMQNFFIRLARVLCHFTHKHHLETAFRKLGA